MRHVAKKSTPSNSSSSVNATASASISGFFTPLGVQTMPSALNPLSVSNTDFQDQQVQQVQQIQHVQQIRMQLISSQDLEKLLRERNDLVESIRNRDKNLYDLQQESSKRHADILLKELEIQVLREENRLLKERLQVVETELHATKTELHATKTELHATNCVDLV
jgi:chromosome segregation ATPase